MEGHRLLGGRTTIRVAYGQAASTDDRRLVPGEPLQARGFVSGPVEVGQWFGFCDERPVAD